MGAPFKYGFQFSVFRKKLIVNPVLVKLVGFEREHDQKLELIYHIPWGDALGKGCFPGARGK
jgi:hypothetical protein